MKNKAMQKMIAAVSLLLAAIVMVVTVSYAWITLSSSPTAEGIKVSIGGGTTILIAPNKSVTENGIQYHYPGVFQSTMDFDLYREYDYLKNVDALMPVSTADGLHWFLPSYYTSVDEEVINGTASVGELRPIQDFQLDMDLEYANLSGDDRSYSGGYVYLDFWVVAPGADYDLRLARGDDQSGSFLIELMSPEESEDGGYALKMTTGSVAASARVGFLVDHNVITDESIMQYYRNSVGYTSDYTMLRGSYAEPGEGIRYSSEHIFTIYEPNGDFHPTGSDGIYIPTNPVAWQSGTPVAADVSDRVTVQLRNRWKAGQYSDYLIQEIFATAIAGKDWNEENVAYEFYHEYLQGQVISYVDSGAFVQSTTALYENVQNGVAHTEALAVSGATDDIVIAHLEKNVPQRIRMFIWIEGQDADCISGSANVTFALNIELAGSHTTYGKTEQEAQG